MHWQKGILINKLLIFKVWLNARFVIKYAYSQNNVEQLMNYLMILVFSLNYILWLTYWRSIRQCYSKTISDCKIDFKQYCTYGLLVHCKVFKLYWNLKERKYIISKEFNSLDFHCQQYVHAWHKSCDNLLHSKYTAIQN